MKRKVIKRKYIKNVSGEELTELYYLLYTKKAFYNFILLYSDEAINMKLTKSELRLIAVDIPVNKLKKEIINLKERL